MAARPKREIRVCESIVTVIAFDLVDLVGLYCVDCVMELDIAEMVKTLIYIVFIEYILRSFRGKTN